MATAEPPPEGYHMFRNGNMFIFANKFPNNPPNSNCPTIQSTDRDATNLYSFWKSDVKVRNVTIRKERTVEQMQEDIENIRTHADNKNPTSWCWRSSRTEITAWCAAQTPKPIALQALLAPLKADKCLDLAGKPKIVIMQTSLMKLQADSDKDTVKKVIPSEADFLYLWSRLDADAYKTDYGSVFIRHLVEQLRAHREKLDVVTIMTRVIAAVENALKGHDKGREDLARYQQLPFSTHQLTQKLYLKELK